MAGPRRSLAGLLLLCLAVLVVGGQQSREADPEVEVQAYALVQTPGCRVQRTPGSLELPAGVLGENCTVSMPGLAQDDPQVFTFTLPEKAADVMTTVFTLHVTGGTASMSLWLPGSSPEGPPDLVQQDLYASQASSEAWLRLPPHAAVSPGQYLLSVSAFAGKPSVTLRASTPPASLTLAPGEAALLADMATACCEGHFNVSDSAFCSIIAPKSLLDPRHPWSDDLCHLAPNACNAQGQLTRLVLPNTGLSCSAFPPQLAQLPALTRIDLSGNSFQGLTAADLAAALAAAPALTELALAAVGLSGQLSCDLLGPSLQVLDLSQNALEGAIPACLTERLAQLYLPFNALSGTLPAMPARSPLTTLYANQQRGGGLSGAIPAGLGASAVSFLNLGGNRLTGLLPRLPPGLALLNVSSNRLTGQLSALPAGIWVADVSGNGLQGRLPSLAGYAALETFVASGNAFAGPPPALPASLRHLELVGCGLEAASLPPLPPRLARLDLSDNPGLGGDISGLDASRLEVLRAANCSLTGQVPPSVTTAPRLFLADLHANRLAGPLPSDWSAPRLQMLMLEANQLEGTIPPSLARLPNLGVLRLGANRLTGGLGEFAAALKDPAAAGGAGGNATTKGLSKLFDFNASANALSGPLPPELGRLGVFNPDITILLPGPDGTQLAPRGLDLANNRLEGPWPTWLLDAVPATLAACSCSLLVDLSGPDMRLACPGNMQVSDYAWQLAAEMRYTCWAGDHSEQLLDRLASPANSDDKIDTSSSARGDGGGPAAPLRPGGIAGLVVGLAVALAALAGGLGLLWKRVIAPRRATRFHKYADDPDAAAAASGDTLPASAPAPQ